MSIRRGLLLWFLVVPQVVAAMELATEDLFFDVKNVALSIIDQVQDGCLPAPQSVSGKMAAALRGNEFVIMDPDDTATPVPEVEVTTLGYAVNADCFVVFTVALVRSVNATVPHSDTLPEDRRQTSLAVRLPVYRSILVGDRQGMQDQIEHEADRAGDDLRVAVDQARNSVETNWPDLWAAYSSATQD